MYTQPPQNARGSQQPGGELVCRLFLWGVSGLWLPVRYRKIPRPYVAHDDVSYLMGHREFCPLWRSFFIVQDYGGVLHIEGHSIRAPHGLIELGPCDDSGALFIGENFYFELTANDI